MLQDNIEIGIKEMALMTSGMA